MKKIILPRKDHDVYFIPLPLKKRGRKINNYVTEQLEKKHPAITPSLVIDLKKYIFNKKTWIMATIINEAVLAEYRVLNRNTIFLTNTSIAVQKKDFMDGGIKTIDDESIGYDKNKNEPVSFPMGTDTKFNNSENAGIPYRIPANCSVFGKKFPVKTAAAILIAAIVLLLPIYLMLKAQEYPAVKIDKKEDIKEESVLKTLPPCTDLLAGISKDIYMEGGKIIKWEYNDAAEPLLMIKMAGIKTTDIYRIFNNYDQLILNDIYDVTYNDDKPYLDINLNLNNALYSKPVYNSFNTQELILPLTCQISEKFKQYGAVILSEVLPSAANNNNFYKITFNAKDKNLLQSLEFLTEFCRDNSIGIRNLDISIQNEGTNFLVSGSLAQYDNYNAINCTIDNQNEKDNFIPLAFGYSEKTETKIIKEIPQTQKLTELIPELPPIGIIRDSSSQITFFRENTGGKIKVKENYAQ